MTRPTLAMLALGALLVSCSGPRSGALPEDLDATWLLERDAESLADREREVQNWIGGCMREQGFDYVPWVPEAPTGDGGASASPIVDDYVLSRSEVEPDPNELIVEALDGSEQTAYFEALWGAVELSTGESPSDRVEDVGCYNAAWVTLYGADAVSARWELSDMVEDLEARVTSHPRYVRRQAEWAGCIAEQGVVASTRGELYDVVIELIEGQAESAGGSDSGSSLDRARDLERELRAIDEECSRELETTGAELRRELQPELLEGIKDSVMLILDDVGEVDHSG